MRHKVTCMDCGKTERIIIEYKEIKSDWKYYGKINVNACKTDKFHWELKDQTKGFCDKDNWKKIPNLCYNPEVKPKMVEMWECPNCFKEQKKEKKQQ